jgi:hypothetical protein
MQIPSHSLRSISLGEHQSSSALPLWICLVSILSASTAIYWLIYRGILWASHLG